MFKRLSLALAGLFAFVAVAQGAGTIPGFSLTPQFDLTGKVMPGCKLFVIQAGTVSTPQNAYSDSGLTLLLSNPLTCDAAGRLPQWFVADGSIKVRLQTSAGVKVFVGDNLLVVGASSGGGGGSPVDPTTILTTGDVKIAYGTGIMTGFVRFNGRTVGSATSGATERANSDVQALFVYLWAVDANLTVSSGRGVSAAADWAANKTITLPDARDRTLAGLGDMGNTDAGRLTSANFGCSPILLGCAGGTETRTIVTLNLPPYTPSVQAYALFYSVQGNSPSASNITSAAMNGQNGTGISNPSVGGTITFAPQGGTSTPLVTTPPRIFITVYIKL